MQPEPNGCVGWNAEVGQVGEVGVGVVMACNYHELVTA